MDIYFSVLLIINSSENMYVSAESVSLFITVTPPPPPIHGGHASKTPGGYQKPQIMLNPIYAMYFSYIHTRIKFNL